MRPAEELTIELAPVDAAETFLVKRFGPKGRPSSRETAAPRRAGPRSPLDRRRHFL
jgi:hypothetical protein